MKKRSPSAFHRMGIVRTGLMMGFLLCVLQVYAQPLNNGSSPSLRMALAKLSEQTGIRFVYCDDLIDAEGPLSGVPLNSLDDVLKKISECKIGYRMYGSNACVLFRERASAHQKYRAVVVRQDILESDKLHSVFPPRSLTKNDAVYPAEALKQRIEGNVNIKVFVNKKGDVTKALIERSSGFRILDSAAIDYAKDMRFMPALADGKPQNIWLAMIIRYEGVNGKK